ncbi:MAG: LysE family translocator [Burkholderiaceae bacterium]
MLGTHDLPLFVGTALVLNATPGVDMLFTLSRTLQHGWRSGVAAALGITAGCIFHTLAAALGLAALLAASAWAFTTIKWLGAAYLIWLAWGMLGTALRDDAPIVGSMVAYLPSAPPARVFMQGFLTNVLNPKVAMFFLALLPQFISTDAPSKPLAFLFLGAVFIIGGSTFLLALVAAAHRLRAFKSGQVSRRVLNGVGGALFAMLAVRLVQAQR